ncbi:MAG: twin-arginine translocation signal domain-containing protein, partial [Candidatus Rokubacteria bacterium]|nr:twin-arginine translocation signal domain-containing protein [Candidatus Rokubacteria bacterium]
MSTEPKDSQAEPEDEGRRDFMKKAAAAGLAAGAVVGAESAVWAQRPVGGGKAFLPDGKLHTREELLTKLGLDPGTSPEAWITITCGSNAAALKLGDAERLMKAGKLKGAELGQRLQGVQKLAPEGLK